MVSPRNPLHDILMFPFLLRVIFVSFYYSMIFLSQMRIFKCCIIGPNFILSNYSDKRISLCHKN